MLQQPFRVKETAPAKPVTRMVVLVCELLACCVVMVMYFRWPKNERRAFTGHASLNNGYGLEVQHSRRRWQSVSLDMLADWRWIWTEIGTYVMIFCVCESGWQMVANGYSRAVHVNLALGLSKGSALVAICGIVLAQAASSVVLLVPALYHAAGSIAPSLAFAAGLWVEASLFGDLSDAATILRTICLTLTAVMLALFRFDRQARNRASQLPTSGIMLNIESFIRKACTTLRTGILCPPLAVVITLGTVYNNPFWCTPGILHEWYHGRFQAGVAVLALCFLVAGQDTRAHLIVGENLEWLYDCVLRKKEAVLVQPRHTRHLGPKKGL